jgi:hypothetical protein
MFNSYEEFKQYVNEEWENGAINELEQDGYIVIDTVDEKTGDTVYRILTEDEFQRLNEK